jgi:4-amino-4-deoxy-L-arabinose transferase-like glycosyltransferase
MLKQSPAREQNEESAKRPGATQATAAASKVETLAPAYKSEYGRFAVVLTGIILVAAAAYLSLAYNWPKFSRAEVFFAECVREMFQADNLVTPLYHGTPFFDKPILAYWFIALSYKILGVSHFAARVPAVFMALGTVALTALGGKHLFGSRQGILAACVLASSLMFMSFANLCMSDMNLVFFDTLSLSLLYLSLENDKKRSIFLYIGSLSMGLAFLTKGPVGIVLPAISFAAYLTLSKQWQKIELVKHVLPCTLILLGAGVPWFMAAFRQNGGGALSYFFIHENLERFAGSTYDTHRPIWFMLQSLLAGMLPWSIFLPFAGFDSVKLILAKSKNAALALAENANKHIYLWLWIAVVCGFFSVSRGKIDYYVLPVYPAASLLIGNFLIAGADQKSKLVKFFSYFAPTVLICAGAASVFFLPRFFNAEQIDGWSVMPSILLVCGALMLTFSLKSEIHKAFKMLFVSVCLLAVAFSFQIYPWITSKQAVIQYIPYIQALEPNARIGVYTSLQNWIDEITFQTDREPMKIEKIKMAEEFLKAPSPSVLLIQENEYAEMSAEARASSHVIASKPFIPRSLNPMYFISKGQKLADKTNLLLVSNGAPKQSK